MTRMLEPGQRAPDFVLPCNDAQVRFYGVAGGVPSVMVLGAGDGDQIAAVAAVRDAVPNGTSVFVVTRDAAVAAATDAFHDESGEVHEAYGVTRAAVLLVLTPNVRVAWVGPLADPHAAMRALAAEVGRCATDDAPTVQRQAPVLLVPDVLDRGRCAQLVEWWTAADPTPTGVESSADSVRGLQRDPSRKRRRDHVIEDRDRLRDLTRHIGARVMPELHKAFAYRATRFEGFKIGCYEATAGGFFTAHRDNLSPATAHRRFALSLNLNDEYEGGEVVFPEYGPQRYRPAAGGALVFSGAHLHEVRPVSRGRRFVLLSFLFSDPDSRG